ncbi:MAG: helix-turn-helix transcriptional regulator [Reyranella sp.]|jgi:AraC-like DNA-binding protein|nr:helix-turn-helix transcriptional regulator [Reyranella sp.]MBL6652113.1 helix-turn-helix transcriptional regulator [Reyranella sp.]
MIGCGTATFTNPDDYRSNVPGAELDLVLMGGDRFRARVTWLGMRRFAIARLEEDVRRIAFITLASAPLFVSFPLGRDDQTIWNGRTLQRGEMVVHSRGERFHQRTRGPCHWGMAALTAGDFATYSRALAGSELVPPATMQIRRPPPRATGEFLRLHHQACRLAQTNPDMAAHREVARALEQGLVRALVNCLAGEDAPSATSPQRERADIMLRFERVLAAHDDRPLSLPELCAAVGARDRTLRACCAELLGMSPTRYGRLRRLNRVRAALLRADPRTANVATVAKKYGFSELGRFAAAYRAAFGEVPSASLRGTGLGPREAAEIA